MFRRHKFRQTFVQTLGEQLQMDLVDMTKYDDKNKGYKWILTSIEILSRYAFTVPVYRKNAVTMEDAVSNCLEKFKDHFGKYPKLVQFDNGTEFYNADVKSLLNKHNIEFFSTYSDKKAAVVERFNRTLNTLMWKYFYSASTYKWLDVLQDFTNNYNSSVNRSIEVRPDSVNESNWTKVWKTLFSHDLGEPPKPKFTIGEYKSVFAKGYEANFTEELFNVAEVYHGHPNTYTINDSAGEPIIGRLYQQELSSAEGRQPDFKIEKILRKRM